MDTIKVRVISIIAAIITVAFVGYYLQRVEDSKPVETTVIEAATDIAEGTQITAEMLATANVYENDLLPSALNNAEDIVGQYAASKIVAGSQIASSMLSDQKASASASSFSYKIPVGMRTVTLTTSQTTSVAGMLQVGDHVDILATYTEEDGENSKTVTKYIAEDVEIAALDQTVVRNTEDASGDDNTSSTDTTTATTVTMFVSPELAQAIVWESQNGNIVLTLRSPDETQKPPVNAFSADDMKNLAVVSGSIDTANETASDQTTENVDNTPAQDTANTSAETDATDTTVEATQPKAEAAHD